MTRKHSHNMPLYVVMHNWPYKERDRAVVWQWTVVCSSLYSDRSEWTWWPLLYETGKSHVILPEMELLIVVCRNICRSILIGDQKQPHSHHSSHLS